MFKESQTKDVMTNGITNIPVFAGPFMNQMKFFHISGITRKKAFSTWSMLRQEPGIISKKR